MANGPLDRLRTVLAAEGSAGGYDLARVLPGSRPIALGWATVDLDRAAAELGNELGVPPERFTDAPDTRALGARCRVAHGLLANGVALALLEPATEGRLAAGLARLGEGPAAIWLAADDLSGAIAALQQAGTPLSVEGAGPFGMERLVLDGPIHGLQRLLVDPPGTIGA